MTDDLTPVSMTEVRGCLVVTMPDDAGDAGFERLFEAVSHRLSSRPVRAAVFDFSGVRILDLHEFGRVRMLARVSGLLGTRVFVVALNPGIAAFLAQAGTDMGDLDFCLEMEDAFAQLVRET